MRGSVKEKRRLTDHDFAHALQFIRLDGLASGRYEPISDRERLYLSLLRADHRPNIYDFILSEPLFRLETVLRRLDREQTTPSFTPDAETAISGP